MHRGPWALVHSLLAHGFMVLGQPLSISLHSQQGTFPSVPVVIAALVWGATWPCQHVLFHSDNEAVVHIINNRSSKVPALMHLLRDLLMSATCFYFSFSAFAFSLPF